LVNERLGTVTQELPPGAQPALGPISTGLGEIYFYSLDYKPAATNKPPTRYEQLLELRSVHDTVVKPAFRGVPGIAEVETCGGYEKQIVVQPHPEKLFSVGLSFSDLAKIIRENVENAGGGLINKGGEQVTVRAAGRVQSLEEIENLPLKFGAAVQPLLVKDVATVTIGSDFRTGAATVNGREAVVAYVLMLTGENSRLVAHRADETIQAVRGKIPASMEITTLYDRSQLVERTIRTVRNNLFEGAILVVAVLFALLGNWRAALIVASAIPLSMLFAVIGMVRYGVSGNLMSLGAVDFGLIVDGSVVIAENAVRIVGLRQRDLGRRLSFDERLRAIAESCRQVGGPMVFGVAIITIVYFPILALAGTEGKMFRPMALTVIFALLGSLLFALTLVPVLCAWFLSRGVAEEESRVMRWARRAYAPVLRFSLAHRLLLVGVTLALLVGSVLLFRQLGAEFVPQLDEGSLVVQLVGPTSISLDESLAMQLQVEEIILTQFPEIAAVFSRIGTPEIGTDPMGANLSDTFMAFAPPEKWRKVNGRTMSRNELIEQITRALEVNVPGQEHLWTQPIEMRFNEMLEGARSDIAVKIYGEDFTTLQQITGEAHAILAKIPGTGDIELDSDNLGLAPVLDVLPDRDAMRRYNVHAAELNQTIATALGGETVGSFFEGNRRIDIVVRMNEAHRSNLAALRDLPVRVAETGLLPLGKVAKTAVRDQVNMIEREGGRRRVGIEINLRGRDLQSWVTDAQRGLRELKLPPGYHIEFGGQFKQMLQARARLMFIVPIALLLIFMLIFAVFGSFWQAVLVFVSVPLAATGGVAALWLRGMPFSISAAIGFIAVSGVAVLNGIMIITFINQLRAEGRALRDAVVEGSLTRLRPKLMTALVASLGFVPMAIATGPGAEVQRPLATVVIGGIISSTFLTLVLLPTFYEWLEKRTETRKVTDYDKVQI
jgi:cobalt-zinc-cadmium resistance protein CzcA